MKAYIFTDYGSGNPNKYQLKVLKNYHLKHDISFNGKHVNTIEINSFGELIQLSDELERRLTVSSTDLTDIEDESAAVIMIEKMC